MKAAGRWTRPFPLLLVIAPLLAGCSGWQSALDAQGAPAQGLRLLIVVIMSVCAVVWLIVIAILLWALFRRRDMRASLPVVDPARERRMAIVVVAGIAVTVAVITAFTVASFLTTRSLAVASDNDLTIHVRGFQWWWEVEYPGGEGGASFKTANEIHIPVGRNVRIELEGMDVVHSFWVPSLAGKQDLIPGRSNALTIRAERAGLYRGQCAEFCGLQHAHMALLVVAQEAADFEGWRGSQLAPAAPAPDDPEAARGRQVFLSGACAACHTVRGTSASGATGPDLTHIGSRQYIAAGLLPTTRGSLAAWIADPQTLKPGNNMPAVALAPEELRAVSAYMASLK